MDYMTADDFCKRYDMNPVVMRRLAKEGTYVERVQLGPRTYRYRLRTDGAEGIDQRAV